MTLPKQINQEPIPSSTQSKNWRHWVALYHDSHLSLPNFCRLHKLPYSAAKNWPRRFEKEQKAQFHPIQIETALENAGAEGFLKPIFLSGPATPSSTPASKSPQSKPKAISSSIETAPDLHVIYQNFTVVIKQNFNPDTLFELLMVLKKVES
jgi:hypothetical protein